jgi:hypothetical protein
MTRSSTPLFPTKIDEEIVDLDAKRMYMKTNAGRFGISSADLSRMDAAVNAAQTAFAAANNPATRSRLDIANRDRAIESAQEIEKKIIDYYVIGNQATTDVDYEMLRIPKPGPHPHLPDPNSAPGLTLTSKQLAIILAFYDMVTGHRGKPRGVQAIEVYMKIGGEPPSSPAEMTERRVGTDSPMRIPFDFEQEDQVVYLVVRWIGTRGVYGPWSEIHKVIILR